MTTAEKITNYQAALYLFATARAKGDTAKEPDPKDYRLTSSQELWLAAKVRKELIG